MYISPIYKHEQCELVIPANQSPLKIMFPDLPNLRNVHLMSMTAYASEIVPTSVLGTEVIDYKLGGLIFVTLQLYNGKQFVNQMPFNEFLKTYNLGTVAIAGTYNAFARDFVGQKVNWPKSYIEFEPNGYASIANDRCILFSIYYKDIKSVEDKDFTFEFRKQQ